MYNDYDDQFARALRYKFAPSIADLMNEMPVMQIASAHSVRLPLRAEVSILQEKNLAAFAVRNRCLVKGEEVMSEQLFSTREFTSYRDAGKVMEIMFDDIKTRFIRELVNKDLEAF